MNTQLVHPAPRPESPPDRAARGARTRRDRGVSIIEFSFVFPFLLILFMSVIDFGIYFFEQHTLQFATREGARVGLTGRQLTDANGNPMSREASIISTIREYATIACPNTSRLSISIYPINADFSDPTGWKGLQDAGDPGAIMRVRCQYTYTFITPFIRQVMSNGQLKIQAEATYKNESF